MSKPIPQPIQNIIEKWAITEQPVTADVIRKHYKERVLLAHPDKPGGSATQFLSVQKDKEDLLAYFITKNFVNEDAHNTKNQSTFFPSIDERFLRGLQGAYELNLSPLDLLSDNIVEKVNAITVTKENIHNILILEATWLFSCSEKVNKRRNLMRNIASNRLIIFERSAAPRIERWFEYQLLIKALLASFVPYKRQLIAPLFQPFKSDSIGALREQLTRPFHSVIQVIYYLEMAAANLLGSILTPLWSRIEYLALVMIRSISPNLLGYDKKHYSEQLKETQREEIRMSGLRSLALLATAGALLVSMFGQAIQLLQESAISLLTLLTLPIRGVNTLIHLFRSPSSSAEPAELFEDSHNSIVLKKEHLSEHTPVISATSNHQPTQSDFPIKNPSSNDSEAGKKPNPGD